jgi:hypothetical protein
MENLRISIGIMAVIIFTGVGVFFIKKREKQPYEIIDSLKIENLKLNIQLKREKLNN